MKTQTSEYLEVTGARYISGYKLRLTFNDGATQLVDFEPFLRKNVHPDFAQYRQVTKFKNYQVHHGNLMWGDYEMIFPVADLYRGEI